MSKMKVCHVGQSKRSCATSKRTIAFQLLPLYF
nr:MAG TPA: hypothetical protein [Caudoviricetes sp.]